MMLALPLVFVGLTASVNFNAHSPGGKTGSPTDGGTCVQCHSGAVQTETGWITTTIPMEGYTVNGEYLITLTGTHAGAAKMGFELTAEDSNGQKVGTFALFNSSETELTNGNNAVTHSSAGVAMTGNSRSWDMVWLAPDSDVGVVTFYAAVNAANGDGGTSGDVIYNISHSVNFNPLSIDDVAIDNRKVYPNPATDFINVNMRSNSDILVIDFSGKVAKVIEAGTSTDRIDISDLESGTYFVKSEKETEMFLKI